MAKLMRDTEPRHNGVPLPPVHVHGAAKEAGMKRELSVERGEQSKDDRILQTRMLTPSEALCLRVANVNVSNRVRRKRVGGEDKILTD